MTTKITLSAIMFMLGFSDLVYAQPTLRLPFPGGQSRTISTGYGGSATHQGNDFYAIDFNIPGDGDCATPAVAAASGIVVRVNTDGLGNGYGNYVDIDHGNDYRTRYAHLLSVSVVPNQNILGGQEVGLVGTTGHSSGCHLHFVEYLNGVSVRPEPMSGYTNFQEGSSYTSDNYPSSRPVHVTNSSGTLQPGQSRPNFFPVSPRMARVEFELTDLTSDLDLYVWRYPPTRYPNWSNWTCRPFMGGTSPERCVFENSSSSLLMYMVHAPRSASSYTLYIRTHFR